MVRELQRKNGVLLRLLFSGWVTGWLGDRVTGGCLGLWRDARVSFISVKRVHPGQKRSKEVKIAVMAGTLEWIELEGMNEWWAGELERR